MASECALGSRARVRGASGLPFTPFVTAGPNAGTLDFAQYNTERLTAFFAVDLRVDRRFVFGRQQLIAFLDVQNVTGRANGGAPQWNPRLRQVERNESVGRLPTIGLNWEF
jgi:type II secretory pathway component PulK